jgi:hypothetical protein
MMKNVVSRLKLAVRLIRYEHDRLGYITRQTRKSHQGRTSLVTDSEVLLTDPEICRHALSSKDGSLMKTRNFMGSPSPRRPGRAGWRLERVPNRS